MARPQDVGRACPYCRFPLKDGIAARACATCGALHHADCFGENDGCAIIGCSGAGGADTAVAETPVTQASAPAGVSLPKAAPQLPASRSAAPWIAAVVCVVVLAIAGVTVAIVLSRGSATSGAAGAPAATTVVTQVQTETAEAAARSAPSAPKARTSASSASVSAATEPPPARPDTTEFHASALTVQVPHGWIAERRDAPRPADAPQFYDSRWHLRGEPDVLLIADYSPGFSGTAAEGARPLEQAHAAKVSSYRLVRHGPIALPAGNGYLWEYTEEGMHVYDVFLQTCGTGYAVAGKAPEARYPDLRATFVAFTRSLEPTCG